MDENKKVSANKQKKIEIVSELNQKLSLAKAVVFTNYEGLTHKQLEGLKREIKPLKAEYVVAKNTLILRAMEQNSIKVADEKAFEGPTGTLLLNDDIVGPLKALAKLIKELGIPHVKFGVMEGNMLTGEQVLKLSTLPTKEVLLTQVVFTLKSPISGLHRSLIWNLQKLVMTLGAVSKAKPADKPEPVPETPIPEEPTNNQTPQPVSEPEPETILSETVKEELQELPNPIAQPPSTQPLAEKKIDIKGGEN